VIVGKGGIKFPDCRCSLDSTDPCDIEHNCNNGKIKNMGKARKTVFHSMEGVDTLVMENLFNCVACCIIVAGIVRCDAKLLLAHLLVDSNS
jgi:hypothetical protein